MDSEDVREDKDDEREKEKPLVGDLNDGYEYIAYDDTGCQEGIKEKKAPSPLLDFGEECEVESQKLQDDRIGGEKDAAKTEKEDSASSSSEDEAENVKNPIPGNVDSDSEVEQEEKKERKASSCYSSSDEEGKVNKNDEDSEVDSEDEIVAGKIQVQDELNDSLIKKGEEDGQSSDDEVEKEVSVEKENFSHDAAFSPDVPAAVAQEVDFEGKYQRFLQNEEEEERECTSMTTGEEENKKEEKEDEADFCLMSDKPQEAMSAVPTTEVVSKVSKSDFSSLHLFHLSEHAGAC